MSLRIKEYVRPKTLEEAYSLLQKEGAEILGGTTYARLSSREIQLAIDLQDLGLDEIKEEENGWISIGSMARLSDLEFHPLLKDFAGGFLPYVLSRIWSLQLRGVATVGGTVVPRWGFSDFLTAVLALETEVEFYKSGRMKLEDFLEKGLKEKDIMTRLLIKKEERRAVFKYMRNSEYDFSIVNVAVSVKVEDGKLYDCRIAVGARPGVAKLATKAMEILKESYDDEHVEMALHAVEDEINFGDDFRWSGEYRKSVALVLLKRALGEVIS